MTNRGNDPVQVPYEAWRRQVEAELGPEGVARLARTSLDGLVLEPLYAADHPADGFMLPASCRPAPGWRVEQEIDWPPAEGELELLAERDVGGLWLRASGALPRPSEVAGPFGGRLPAVVLAADAAARAQEWAEALGAAAGGSLGFDPLGAAAHAGGTPAAAWRGEASSLAGLCTGAGAAVRALVASDEVYHRAGADLAQELAFALATAVEYLRALAGAGLSPPAAAGQILLRLSVGRGFYRQVAKLRAARLLWAMVAGVAGGGAAPPPFLAAVTSWRTKTVRDPWNNLLRETNEAMAAVAGGCDALVTRPYGEPAGGDRARGRRLAVNLQLVLREEAGLGRVGDPLGGSWAVEELTRRLAERAWELLGEVEAAGGMEAALAGGLVADRVAASAARRREELASRALPVVGVSVYPPAAGEREARAAAEEQAPSGRGRLAGWRDEDAAAGAAAGGVEA